MDLSLMRRWRHSQVFILSLYLASALLGVLGYGEQGPLGTRCLPEIIIADDGRVVIYDVVVSVPMRRLFLIGPNKPLWVVQTIPEHQANTVSFAHTFDARPNPQVGSTCQFSLAANGEEAGSTAIDLVSTIAFVHDPIFNVNVAFCSVPDSAMSLLLKGEAPVTVTVKLVPAPQSQGQQAVILENLPVCIAGGTGTHGLGKPAIYASLCCIIRNEADYLEEWLEYSRMIGVEHFYLYDHGSTDKTQELLAGYIAADIVTLHQWEFAGYPQREAHSHCTHRYAHATTWLGLMDVDEFIMPARRRTIIPLLEHFDQESVVLRLQAEMFGTSVPLS